MKRVITNIAFLVLGGVAGIGLIGPKLHGQVPAAPPMPKELSSYREVVKAVLPAVVSVESAPRRIAKSKQTPRTPQFDDSQMPPEFRKFFDKMPVPQFDFPDDMPNHSIGSGFVYDANGVIVTNYHVVKGADEVTVRLHDGRTFVTKDIKTDPRTDLAVIRIKASSPLPTLQMGDSGAAEIGDRVLAVGAPYGLTGSVTAGIISGKSRNLRANTHEDYLQTDAAINPGNSGGPLVMLDGKVVGINTAIKSSTGGSNGVGLAISSNVAKSIVEQLVKDGVVRRGYLGVQVNSLDPAVATRLGVPDKKGVVIAKVFEGSPAAKSGMQAGDVLTRVGNDAIHDGAELQHRISLLPLNKAVEVSVVRDGKATPLQVTIEEQPKDFGVASTPVTPPRGEGREGKMIEKLGFAIDDLTPEMASRFNIEKDRSGVVITQVEPGSLAAEADLRPGNMVLKVENQAVNNATDARRLLEQASLERGILLQIRSAQGGVGFVVLKSAVEN